MRAGGESNRSIGRIIQKSPEDLRALRWHGLGSLGAFAAKNLCKLDQFIVKDARADSDDPAQGYRHDHAHRSDLIPRGIPI